MGKLTKEEYIYREEIRRVLKRIDRDCDGIIVEGIDDYKVLKELGVSTRIFRLSGKSFVDLAETVSHCCKTVTILTDYDEEGKKINKRLKRLLVPELDVMSSYRKEFGKVLTSKDRFCIEDIRPLLVDSLDKFDEVKLSRMYTDLG